MCSRHEDSLAARLGNAQKVGRSPDQSKLALRVLNLEEDDQKFGAQAVADQLDQESTGPELQASGVDPMESSLRKVKCVQLEGLD